VCGIAGIVRFNGDPVALETLTRMADSMAHRGPDGEGFHLSGRVGFAHRRLAIIDPEGGRQPLVERHSKTAITYNGEVYNYIEIRSELGGSFESGCDTEVVLRAWQRWGIAALQRFRGMFAFALHDPAADKVFLVRDRLGIKPLYYKLTSEGVVFASELGAITAVEDDLQIDPQSLSLYLRYGYVPAPHTVYCNVFKLEPGHFLAIDIGAGRVEKSRYWQVHSDVRPVDEGAALDELNELLKETIRLYVRSDVPFGAFLSGGVDSSLVTALMCEALGEGVRSYSIGFDDQLYSELPFAAEAAERLHTKHRAEVMHPDLSIEYLQRVAMGFGEPFADSSALPTRLVSELASRDVKMVLSGDGGDELFAGYHSYTAVERRRRQAPLVPFYKAISRLAGDGRIGAIAAARAIDWPSEHHRQRNTFNEAERIRLTGIVAPEDTRLDTPPAKVDPVTWCQERDLVTYLPDDILTKVDRMSMVHSLEVRVPLLDHKLVEFALRLPLALRLREDKGEFIGKYLLKRATERFFPRSFIQRPKWGFGIPLQRWLQGPLQSVVRDLLEAPSAGGNYIDRNTMRRMVDDFYSGRPVAAGQIWTLLSFELWRSGVRHPANVDRQRVIH
jgi:asparagine synthase (glutamine-hydrolysing)